jgi:hypothetical protein
MRSPCYAAIAQWDLTGPKERGDGGKKEKQEGSALETKGVRWIKERGVVLCGFLMIR